MYYCMLIDDYQRLDNCSIRPNSKGSVVNMYYDLHDSIYTSAGDLQSDKQSATLDTSYYSQPRVPAVPAKKRTYGIVFC